MTYAEQLSKLSQDVPTLRDGYTKDELQSLYRDAKRLMLFAACKLAEWEDD